MHEVSGMRQPYAFGASDLYPLRGVAPGAPTAARAGGLTTAWAGGFTAGSGDPALWAGDPADTAGEPALRTGDPTPRVR
ncbi:hypothetical protein GCM10029978_108840 [Actinoallomurus acanthiterrae]